MDTRNRTNAEWRTLVETKIAEVELADYDITFEGPSDIARSIDHTALKPESTEAQIDQLCGEARKYDFKVTFQLLRTMFPFYYNCLKLITLDSPVVSMVPGYSVPSTT